MTNRMKVIISAFIVVIGLSMTSDGFGGVIFSDDFESGNYNQWDVWLQSGNCTTDTTLTVNSEAKRTGSYGVDISYIIDDSPRGDCQLHQDNNTSLVRTISPAQRHYFFRGYFKLPMDRNKLCSSSPVVQRKLVYFKPVNWGSGAWAFFVNAWPWGSGCMANGYAVSVGYGNAGGTGVTLWGDNPGDGFVTSGNHIFENTWYYLEIEVEYRTYGTDILRIWLSPDGGTPVRILERTNLTLRSSPDVSANLGLGIIELGRQVDVNRTQWSQSVNEHRYWDDVVFSTEYIGPTSQTPLAPSSPKGFKIVN